MSNYEKAVRLMVVTELSQREIAKELNLTEQTISNYKKKESYPQLRQQYEEAFLADLTAPAMRTMRELLSAKSEFVRYSAASDILDRTGYKPTERQEIDAHVKTDKLDSILEQLGDGHE